MEPSQHLWLGWQALGIQLLTMHSGLPSSACTAADTSDVGSIADIYCNGGSYVEQL